MRVQNRSYHPHIELTVMYDSGDIHISLHTSPTVVRLNALYVVTSCPEFAARERHLYRTLVVSMAKHPTCFDDVAGKIATFSKNKLRPTYRDLPPVISPESLHPKITDLDAIIATLASSYRIATLIVQGVGESTRLRALPVHALRTRADLTSRLLTTLTHLTLVRISASFGDTPLAITRATIPSSIRAVTYVTAMFTPVDANVLYALTSVATHVARSVVAVAPAPGPSLHVTFLSLATRQPDDPDMSYLNAIINEYPSLKIIDNANRAGLKSIPAHFKTNPAISHPTLERVFGLEYRPDHASRLPHLLYTPSKSIQSRTFINALLSFPFHPATSYIWQYLPVVVHPSSRWKSMSQIRLLRFAHLFASFLLASIRLAPASDPHVTVGVLRHFTSLDGLSGPEHAGTHGTWRELPRV